ASPIAGWPSTSTDTMPAVAIPIPPLPEVPAAFAAAGFTRVRLLGGFGHVRNALIRETNDGFVLVGEGTLDLLDPVRITVEMDAHDASDRVWRESLPQELQWKFDHSDM